MNETTEIKSTHRFELVPDGWALIVDDHPLFCDALELTLRSIANFSDVRTGASLAEGISVIEEHGSPGLVVLDLNLPDVTGLNGLIRMVNQIDPAPVIVVSSMTDNRVIATAMQSGAAGYVPKHSPRAVFKTAIDAIRDGRIFVPENFVATEVPSVHAEAVRKLSSLTQQQSRILELICDGKLNKQIAYELSIAETTVKAHVTSIMRKLGVQSRTQAVLVAQDAKFVSILPESDSDG